MIDNGMVSLCSLCCRVAMLGIVFDHSQHDDADVVVCLNIMVLLLCCMSHVSCCCYLVHDGACVSYVIVCLYAVMALSLYCFVFS